MYTATTWMYCYSICSGSEGVMFKSLHLKCFWVIKMLLAHGSSPEAHEPTAKRGGAGQPSQHSGLRSA